MDTESGEDAQQWQALAMAFMTALSNAMHSASIAALQGILVTCPTSVSHGTLGYGARLQSLGSLLPLHACLLDIPDLTVHRMPQLGNRG